MKNILIINFNTQKLTEACIRSVNKHTPGCHIFVFDNSDKEPFVNTFKNVNIIDNTNGQIIDFNKWLEKYPNRIKSNGKTNNWGSAKHAYTINKCMELIRENFVLLDSDILLKKDISELFREDLLYVAETVLQPKSKIRRVLPYICFINNELCSKNDVHYFNDDYMHGLRKTIKSDSYDTGAYFYLACEKLKHEEIKCNDYIEHYKAGSWTPEADKARKTKHISVDEWLEINRDLWDENLDGNLTEVSRKSTPEPEKPKPAPEEKVMPVEKKKEAEVKYLKMAKTSDRKIGVLNR